MREETRAKLDELVRLSRWYEYKALVIGAALTVGLGLLAIAYSIVVSEHDVNGTVQWAVWKIDHDTGDKYADLQVMLADGRLVRAGTRGNSLPARDSDILVRERVRGIGYRTYTWEGATPPAEQSK